MKTVERICVIDDDNIYSIAIRHIIARAGISRDTLFFRNGQLAFDYLEENFERENMLPDIILLDLNMPVLDGWQFLDKYESFSQKLARQIPIYIVSSSIDEEEFSRAKKFVSVKDFLTKPVSTAKLIEIVSDQDILFPNG